jgi:acyl-CoA reductase-like NAD-dependent aldehyde dehydrogenase
MAKLISYNPANGKRVGEVKISTKKDVNDSVKQAKKAFLSWKETSITKRVGYIEEFRKKILADRKNLAKLVTEEMGKPYKETFDDVFWDQSYLKYYIKEGPVFLKDEIIFKKKNKESKIVYEPYGICGVIAPWNFPLGMAIWGIVPNLIAGNTVVFKPSEYTPLCSQRLINHLLQTGLPKGVVNIVQGNKEVGKTLIDSEVDLVWFTGSSKVGQEIYEKCAKKFIKCLLELGGSSPAIVFADADLDYVIDNLYWARFLNNGQVCDAVKRCFVEEKIFDKFVQNFAKLLKTKKVGNPFLNVDFGPLISKKQLELLQNQVQDAIKKGAKVILGGKRPKDIELQKGFFYEPTILTNVTSNMQVMTDEVFGPVLPVIPFDSIKGVIKMANKTKYGLSSQIYTKNLKRAQKIASEIQAGTISINSNNYLSPKSPFGGYKKSGLGREGGRFGLYELVQIKHLYIKK